MIDASIPLGAQVMQLDDPLDRQQKVAALSQMAMQNRYMQSKMDAEGRTANLSNMRGQAYLKSGGDPAALRTALMNNGDYEGLIAHDKSQLEAQKAQGELASQKAGLGDKLIGLRAKAAQFGYTGATPQHAAQAAQLLSQSGDTEGAQAIQSALEQNPDATPEQVKAFFQPHLAASQTPGDLLNPKYQDVGGQLVDMNPNTKAAAINKTQSPESLASNQVTRRGQDMVDARSKEVNVAGKAPAGYRYAPDGQTLQAIPGGPADTKNEQATEAQRVRDEGYLGKANLVLDKVDEALNKTGFLTSGLTGKSLSLVPGTGAYDLDKTVETIKANLGFQELAAMRASSPTGGALGAIAVKELEFLQSAVSSLDVGQSEGQQKSNLMKVKRHYQAWKKTIGKSGNAGDSKQAPSKDGGASGGWEDL